MERALVQEARIRRLNQAGLQRGEFVLYWMKAVQRACL